MRRLNRIPHVERVQVVRPHTIEPHVDDGLIRTLEFIPGQDESMYAPLSDPRFFADVTVDHETITWPNGLGPDPVVLHGDRAPVGKTHSVLAITPQQIRQGSDKPNLLLKRRHAQLTRGT
jgi:hypothetical protein